MNNPVDKKADAIELLERKFKRQLFWIIAISLILIIGLWIINYLLSWNGVNFGNKFNIVNSLFSGFAFAGIIITVLLQKQELTLQRKELEATRDVFLKQNNLMVSQRNDAIFFKLLENHRQLVEGFKTGDKKLLNPNDIFKKKSSGPIYNSEIVSGYQNLRVIAEYLKTYLKCYSDSFKQKRIIHFLLAKHLDFDSLMNSNSMISLHFRELQNLYKFVQDKLAGDSFYLNTLDVNLTYDERFLFELSYEYFPFEREELTYKNKNFFNPKKYVNFRENILPYCRTEALSDIDESVWILVQTNGNIKSAELNIYARDGQFRYMDIKEKVPISIENFGITESGLYQLDIDLIECLIRSNLNIHNYPIHSTKPISGIYFLFKTEVEINHNVFDYYFKLNFTESIRSFGTEGTFQLISFRNLEIAEINEETYKDFIQADRDFSKKPKTPKPQLTKIELINRLIWDYFKINPNTELIPAKDLMPEFVDAGIFKLDVKDGKPIRDILRGLDKEGRLNEIPFVHPERKRKNTNWYFKRPN